METQETVVGGFTVLGTDIEPLALKSSTYVPAWIRNVHPISPCIANDDVSELDMTNDDVLRGLDAKLVALLSANGIKQLFPVQRAIVPELLRQIASGMDIGDGGLRCRDVCCAAPTGSGKTLAFVLPIVQTLGSRVVPHIRALAVLPTGDLARQIAHVFQTYGAAFDLKVGLAIGLKKLALEQASIVEKGEQGVYSLVDILVCTPGRLVEHLASTEGLSLKHLRFLVIDEADRIMREMKADWLRHVEAASGQPGCRRLATAGSAIGGPWPFQKLLFSATLTHDVQLLEQLNLYRPCLYTAAPSNSPTCTSAPKRPRHNSKAAATDADGITLTPQLASLPSSLKELYLVVTLPLKPLSVVYLVKVLGFRRLLIFVEAKVNVKRLCDTLQFCLGDAVSVQAVSSAVSIDRRQKLLKQFARGQVDLLVCSDVLARGMDLANVDCVVSYDCPKHMETYVHRAGRTARAGKTGTSVVLLEQGQVAGFRTLLAERFERLTAVSMLAEKVDALRPTYEAALDSLRHKVRGRHRSNKSLSRITAVANDSVQRGADHAGRKRSFAQCTANSHRGS